MFAALFIVALAAPARGDQWPAPRAMNVFSDSGRFFVRVLPGDDVGSAMGFAGVKRGSPAKAEFYARGANRSYRLVTEIRLDNPVAPVDALVSNDGTLITFDNWHNLGFGTVVAIYRADGTTIAAYDLETLYNHDSGRIAKIPRSVSSRHWRCAPFHYTDPATQTDVFVRERLGGSFVFRLATGTYDYRAGEARDCG